MALRKNVLNVALGAAIALTVVPLASAFQLDAEAAAEERKLLGISYSRMAWLERQIAQVGAPLFFSDPVHEELTTRIFGCDGSVELCGGSDSIAADPAVLVGVRWNDDPPFMLGAAALSKTSCVSQTIRFQTQPRCWLQLVMAAEMGAAAGKVYGPGDAMLYRTHFGDLQFLHAMASGENVPAEVTRREMLEWAEFIWRVAIKEFPRTMLLKDVPVDGIRTHFGNTSWDVRGLFILGTPLLERRVDQVAFGSLLHMLQDSFAKGHTDRVMADPAERCTLGADSIRAPGRIREFRSYGKQDHDAHAAADSIEAKDRHLQEQPDVVDAGRPLVAAFDDRLPWSQVEPYFACIFATTDAAQPASAGAAFAKQE